MFSKSQITLRLQNLEQHLQQENPVLSNAVGSFRELDRISRRLGFFDREESHATRTAWWPLISVLGLYSSGKSTFINHFLKQKLQATGNQAVDDKFTVLCFTNEETGRVLPGLALDADPRFPLYKISQAIEEVSEGEGQRIDAYLQLKTCNSEQLRGKILIDSPGFDADAQRTSTLRITDHIIDLSDLVLVFFDARHPESGSMRDTLEHLVNGTIHRRDSTKFLFVLNQIDTTAQEDNPEEVFAAWQRALAQYGMTAGRCYTIYNPDVAIPIEDPNVRARFESKRDGDLKDLLHRVEQVSVERAYRIVGMLEETANMLEKEVVPLVERFLQNWRRKCLWLDGAIFGGLVLAFFVVTIWGGYWNGTNLDGPLVSKLITSTGTKYGVIAALLLIAGFIHFSVRRWAAKKVTDKLLTEVQDQNLHPNYVRAFRKNSRWCRSLFNMKAVGWGRRSLKQLAKVIDDTNLYIQRLNDRYTNPTGEEKAAQGAERQASVTASENEQQNGDPEGSVQETSSEIKAEERAH